MEMHCHCNDATGYRCPMHKAPMTAPFDWAGLRDELAKALCRADPDVRMGDADGVVEQRVQHLWRDYLDDAAAVIAALRTRIEAAFVPVEEYRSTQETLVNMHARAEAAEAENARLRDVPNHIWAEARDTEWDAGFNHAVKLFRQTLGGEHER